MRSLLPGAMITVPCFTSQATAGVPLSRRGTIRVCAACSGGQKKLHQRPHHLVGDLSWSSYEEAITRWSLWKASRWTSESVLRKFPTSARLFGSQQCHFGLVKDSETTRPGFRNTPADPCFQSFLQSIDPESNSRAGREALPAALPS